MKRADITDERALSLAAAWARDPRSNPGVVDALVAEGVPVKVAYAKVEHMLSRGLLDCGVSPRFAWPRGHGAAPPPPDGWLAA